jgi:large subunit ribosomal protein L25
MATKENKLIAESREVTGSANARRLRRAGRLPGVINLDGGASRLVQMDRHKFEMTLRHHTSENVIFDLAIDEKEPLKVLLKDVQRSPVTGTVVHVDFIEISMTKKMRVRIPIVLVGEPLGVLHEGGVLEQMLRDLEVECLPSDLVDAIELDVSGLKLHESLLAGQLQIGSKLTVLTPKHLAVAGVMEPKKEEEVVAEASAEGVLPTEPELIGKEKKEGEEEGEEGEEGKEKAAPKEKAEGKDKAKAAPDAKAKAGESKGKAAAPDAKGKGEAKGKESPKK